MKNETVNPGISAAAGSQSGTAATQTRSKARWHAPELKRLDVDLTAGVAKTDNDNDQHAQNKLLS